MSEAQLLSIIASQFVLLVALVGVVYRGMDKRLGAVEARDNSAVIVVRLDALVLTVAKIEGRVESSIKDEREFHYNWRHDEYAPRMQEVQQKLFPLEQNVQGIEARVVALERKVFNGWHSPTK